MFHGSGVYSVDKRHSRLQAKGGMLTSTVIAGVSSKTTSHLIPGSEIISRVQKSYACEDT